MQHGHPNRRRGAGKDRPTVKSSHATVPDTEPRWPAILAYVLVFAFVQLLPARYQVLGSWFGWVLFSIGAGSMLAVALAPASLFWLSVERGAIVGIFALILSLIIITMVRLVKDMVAVKHGYGGITLLETACGIWTVTVVNFALLYWRVDRSGPKARAGDFRFAEENDPQSAIGWQPRFMDYFFLAFATSTSFTGTEFSRPASHRAKLMLMLQALISLTTLFLIASRAISTLS